MTHGARILASSGSTVQDELAVLKRVENKSINPDCNVVAVAGMNAVKEALIQVAQGYIPVRSSYILSWSICRYCFISAGSYR